MSICLTTEEISLLTAGLTLPRCQLKELHRRGFSRARLVRGKVILERAHFEAVSRGEFTGTPAKRDTARPTLRAIK